jgi:hypothetical protein
MTLRKKNEGVGNRKVQYFPSPPKNPWVRIELPAEI